MMKKSQNNKNAPSDARLIAVRLLLDVVQNNRSLDQVLSHHALPVDSFVKACLFGCCRYYYRLDFFLQQLLRKPLKSKDADLRLLLLLGLYELAYLSTPDYAVINQTVAVVEVLNKTWAKGLVNAVLRNFLRQRASLEQMACKNLVATHAHPAWLITQLQTDWSEHWQQILEANNQHPPLTLRINPRKTTRDNYLALLSQIPATPHPLIHTALTITSPQPVTTLPHFSEGWFSVQDAAAQLAADLLDVQPHQRVLDACAAPGGKTCHILEQQPQLGELVAIDKVQNRCDKIHDNLQRLGLSAQVICADANDPKSWWDGQFFERILLDAPCSATGVIRRHPDIKLLRREKNIAALAAQQTQLLRQLWPLLNPGGLLLYVTCSILHAENEAVISAFLQQHTDAKMASLAMPCGQTLQYGQQIFPGTEQMDGFYYAGISKVE